MGDITLILKPNSTDSNFSDEKLEFKSDPNEETTTFTLGRGTTGLHIDDKKCSRQQAKLTLHQSGKVEVTWVRTIDHQILMLRLEQIQCLFKAGKQEDHFNL